MRHISSILATCVLAVASLSCQAESGPPAARDGPTASPAASAAPTAKTTIGAQVVPDSMDLAAHDPAADGHAPGARRKEITVPVFTVDREYRSMTGPLESMQVRLTDTPELLWLTGYRAVMVGEDGTTPMPQDYMCHSNLDLNPTKHQQRFTNQRVSDGRLFTLSQGQLQIDFPPGFGMPIWSDEDLNLTAQVLNLNPGGDPVKVRHKITIEYVRDADLKQPMKPLVSAGVYGMKLVKGDSGYMGLEHPDPQQHGPGCLPGKAASRSEYSDPQGQIFTGHWVVEPGTEENHTRITPMLNIAYDTTVHYIAVHLHPFAERVELRDLTTKETLFKSDVQPLDGRIGIERVDYYSSEKGIPLTTQHEYELVSFYNNTTDKQQDSMAVLYMYTLDKTFDHDRVIREGQQAGVQKVADPKAGA